jgi:hypothetical protein
MAKPSFIHHWKFRLLCSILNENEAHTLGHIQLIWDCANTLQIPEFPSADAVESVAYWEGEKGKLVKALVECRLLEKTKNNTWTIHDYYDHCPDWIKRKNTSNKVPGEKKSESVKTNEVSCAVEESRKNKDIDPWYLSDGEILPRIMKYEKDKSDKQVNYWKEKLRVLKKKGYMSELKDILKEIWNSEKYSVEKDVGHFKNPAGYINKKVKEMLHE